MLEEKFCPEIVVKANEKGKDLKPVASYFYPDASIHYVGKVTVNAELEVIISPLMDGARIYAIETPGKKIERKRNWNPSITPAVYRKKIRVHHDPMFHVGPYTRPNGGENFFRILVIKDDYLEHVEIGLVSQKGKFFAVKQLTRQGSVYYDQKHGKAFFSQFNDWPDMTEFLTDIMSSFMTGKKLGPVPDYTPNGLPATEHEELTDDTAETVWWSLIQQIGMVIDRQGRVARIHWENLKRPGSELAYLAPGEIVKFEKIGPPRQNPERKTTFKWEIYGAKVITS